MIAAMDDQQLTAAQGQANQRFLERAVKIRTDLSRETIDEYLSALVNVTFYAATCESEAGVELYVTRYGGDATPLVPVFTSLEQYRAFQTVIPDRFRAAPIGSVALCRMAVECFPPTATLAIDPAQPGFLRVPPNLIRDVAAATWQPNN